MIAFLVWLLAPLFEVLAAVLPRAVEGDTIDSCTLAFALKDAGYKATFRRGDEPTEVVPSRPRKKKRRRVRTS